MKCKRCGIQVKQEKCDYCGVCNECGKIEEAERLEQLGKLSEKEWLELEEEELLQERGRKAYAQGYRYCVKFAPDSNVEPLFFKSSKQVGQFMRENHPNEKNYRGYPIDEDGSEVEQS